MSIEDLTHSGESNSKREVIYLPEDPSYKSDRSYQLEELVETSVKKPSDILSRLNFIIKAHREVGDILSLVNDFCYDSNSILKKYHSYDIYLRDFDQVVELLYEAQVLGYNKTPYEFLYYYKNQFPIPIKEILKDTCNNMNWYLRRHDKNFLNGGFIFKRQLKVLHSDIIELTAKCQSDVIRCRDAIRM